MATRTKVNSESVLASIMAEESFWPSEPQSISDTGLPISVVESLVIKRLAVIGILRIMPLQEAFANLRPAARTPAYRTGQTISSFGEFREFDLIDVEDGVI